MTSETCGCLRMDEDVGEGDLMGRRGGIKEAEVGGVAMSLVLGPVLADAELWFVKDSYDSDLNESRWKVGYWKADCLRVLEVVGEFEDDVPVS